ncbi:MAG: ABC transporter permease subunit [Holophagales bacterium]|nr:ABC transporter permease subunit [Holophagales bacterium]
MRLHGPLLALYRGEMRMLARDGRTLFAAVILPALILPLVFSATRLAERGRAERIGAQSFSYAVVGPEADLARQLLALGETPATEAPDRAPGAASDPPRPELTEVRSENPHVQLENRALHVVLHAAAGPEEGELAGLPRLELVFLADWHYSQTAMVELRQRLERARILDRRGVLEALGAELPEEQLLAVVSRRDLATAGQRTGAEVGRFATLFLMFFLLTGGSVVAADTLAGEKERGTLETLLSSAISRRDLVLAKLLGIFTLAVVILLVQLLNLSLYTWLGVVELPEYFRLELTPGASLALLLLVLPLAASVSALLLWVSGRARSYKEFQIRFFPFTLLALLPAAAAVLPALELRSAVVLVPIANVSVAVREILTGRFDVPMLLLAWLVSTAVAVAAARASIRTLGSERLMTAARRDRAEHLGGPELFPRHAVGWFALMWVVVFLGSVAVPALGSLRAQVLFNVAGVFLGGSFLLMRRYRLRADTVLWPRGVPVLAWVAVLLGAPATLLASVALARLGRWLLPMPRELMEAFARGLLGVELPLWQLLFFVALLPAVGEEAAFRGLLLHGLRQRMPAALAVIASSAVFALFHMNLFRLAPTAFLGMVLAVVTLATGSILPAVLWHALNNALALVLVRAGIDLAALHPRVYAASALASALAFLLLWRSRRSLAGRQRR